MKKLYKILYAYKTLLKDKIILLNGKEITTTKEFIKEVMKGDE